MSTHDYHIANQSGADFRADLNNALLAIVTVNSSATEPSTTFAHQLWVDTANSVLKIRNAADNAWITTGVSITASNTFTGDLTGNVVGNVTGNLVGNVTGDLTGNADSADTLSTARTISLSGDVVGSVSFDGSANVDIDTVVQINSITLGTDTTGDYVESMSGGTGVTVTGGTGEGSTPSIAIGQAVATTDDVTFNIITASEEFIGDLEGGIRFNAKADGALSKGDVVYISGVSGDVPTVGQAKADDASKMPAFGLALSDANDNAALQVVTFGTIEELDTSGVSEGQILYVSTTAGAYTTTAPTGESSQIQNIGKVIRSHASAGSIKVGGAGRSNATPNLDNGKIFIGNGSNQAVTSTLDTSIVVENTNLYYTTARSNTDFDTRLATKDTGDLTEGSNLYYTTARVNSDFDTRLATKSTTDLTEGTNLYYTSARFDSAFTSKDTDDLSEGSTNLYYTTARFDSAFGNKTTADLTENTNLYYTDTRANSAIDARVTKAFVDALGIQASSVDANSVALGTDTTGNYVATITGTANKISVSGSGSESADITLSLPDDVQIASDLTVAGNLTVNGTLTSLDTTNLDIEDNLFQLNAGLTGSPVNDSGMLINRGTADNGIFMWDESVDKFTLGLTTADGSATGNITLNSLGTLVANIEGDVTGTVSSLSNHDTGDLAEGSNLYYTDARSRSAISATGDISYNSSTGVISFTQATAPVTSVNTQTGAVVLDTDDIGEGSTNIYFTNARADTRINLQTGVNLDLSSKSTSDLSEGSNLYYTDARARASISEDSTQLSYNSTTGVLSYTQGDTDTVSEGTTNLYYTDARANSAIDTRVTKTFVDALNVVAASATGNAGTATALATARDFSIAGDITASAVSFDGTGNVALSASIDANTVGITEINVTDGTNGQVLTTDGAGNLSFSTVSGTTINNNADNRVITGSGTANTLNGEAGLTYDGSDLNVTGTITSSGNITGTLATAAQPNITSVGTLTGFTSTGIDDNANATAITIDSSEIVSIGHTSAVNDANAPLQLNAPSGGQKFMMVNANGSYGLMLGYDMANSTARIRNIQNTPLTFETNNAERMRIDSSGRLLVNLTSNDNGAFIQTKDAGSGCYGWTEGTSAVDARIFANTSQGAVIATQSAHPLALQTSGQERMRIDSSGNVGINNTVASTIDAVNTSGNLVVGSGSGSEGISVYSGNTNLGSLCFADGTSGTSTYTGYITYNHSSNHMEFGTGGGTERMRIDSSGNVGIGGTPVAGAKLQSQGALFVNGVISTSPSSPTLAIDYASGGARFISYDHSTNDPRIYFITSSSTSTNERMRIDSSGRVGIGTNSPSALLDVAYGDYQNSGALRIGADIGTNTSRTNSTRKIGALTVPHYTTAEDDIVVFLQDSFDAGTATLSIGGGSGFFNSPSHINFFTSTDGTTNGSERMRIDSSGNVGIGMTSPGSKLHLKEGSTNGVAQISWENDARRWAMGVHGGLSDGLTIYDVQGGVTRFYIGTNGNVGIGNDNTSPSSTLDVNGSLSKSSGSFKIDHPLESKKDTHHLVHSFVEAPQADNIYRGVVTLVDGSATINLDTEAGMTEGTFVLLNTNTSCFTSNESDWDAVKGNVSENILTISCQNTSSTATISWLVIGERHDQHMIDTEWTDENGKVIVEPLKGETE